MSQLSPDSPRFVAASVRLVVPPAPLVPPARQRGQLVRPLVAGLAILHRDGRHAAWQVDVYPDSRLLPHTPRSLAGIDRVVRMHRALGRACRVGAALASPTDLVAESGSWPPSQARRDCRSGRSPEMYGWALMYQLPGMRGTASIDPHDRFDELPAFYESALELIDRSTFLTARGIPNRPIALLTRPEDFAGPAGGSGANRFYPQARFHRPCTLDALR